MSNQQPKSWAASILGFALLVLAACWALNLAAHLIVEVLPILIGIAIVAVAGLIVLRHFGPHDRW